MSKLLDAAKAAAAREDAKPLAARIPAEPGWRAVIVVPTGEPEPDGRQDCRVELRPIGFWGMDSAHLAKPGDFLSALTGTMSSPRLIPLDSDGKRFPSLDVQSIEPPGRDNEAVLQEAIERLQRLTDAYLKGGAMGAMMESMRPPAP